MRLLCNIKQVLGHNVGFLQERELRRELDPQLKNIFMTMSGFQYTWETERIKQGPYLVKPITASWNQQVKEDFLRLVSNPETLANLQAHSEKTEKIMLAAQALNDTHDFGNFYHVLEPVDTKHHFELHTLIPQFMLTQIQDHPEDYAIVIGETRFIV